MNKFFEFLSKHGTPIAVLLMATSGVAMAREDEDWQYFRACWALGASVMLVLLLIADRKQAAKAKTKLTPTRS